MDKKLTLIFLFCFSLLYSQKKEFRQAQKLFKQDKVTESKEILLSNSDLIINSNDSNMLLFSLLDEACNVVDCRDDIDCCGTNELHCIGDDTASSGNNILLRELMVLFIIILYFCQVL